MTPNHGSVATPDLTKNAKLRIGLQSSSGCWSPLLLRQRWVWAGAGFWPFLAGSDRSRTGL